MNTVIFALLCVFISVSAQATSTSTIYLINHGEGKVLLGKTSLTQCGELRAKQLSTLLSKADISAIYSTSNSLALSTVQPLSSTKNTPVKNYSRQYIEQLALQLSLKGKNALVVGSELIISQLIDLLVPFQKSNRQRKSPQGLFQIHLSAHGAILTEFSLVNNCRI